MIEAFIISMNNFFFITGDYLIITSNANMMITDYEEKEENIKNDYDDALTTALKLIKKMNILRT